MFSEEKLSQPGQKNHQFIGNKSFYLNTSNRLEYKKNCISKLSIKMFIKRKARGGKAYAYGMLLSFKAMVTYKQNFLTSRRTTVSVAK